MRVTELHTHTCNQATLHQAHVISVSAHVSGLSQAIWAAHDGAAVAWVTVDTEGHAPSKRFHHTTTLFDGKLNVVASFSKRTLFRDTSSQREPFSKTTLFKENPFQR